MLFPAAFLHTVLFPSKPSLDGLAPTSPSIQTPYGLAGRRVSLVDVVVVLYQGYQFVLWI
jgi:hypothetical protein